MIQVDRQYWWNKNGNFGDEIGPVITRHLLGKELRLAKRDEENVLLGPGSIIDYCERFRSSIVWGSGIDPHYGKAPARSSDVTFLAVRGPETRRRLGIKVDVLGDPGILMPEIHPARPGGGPVSIVVHHTTVNRRLRDRLLFDPYRTRYRIIEPCRDYQTVIDEICASDFVFCQSLHGAIIAHAYGVPWAWWRGFHGRLAAFKWLDWFGSIGVKPRSFLLSEERGARRWADGIRPTQIDRSALKQALLEHAC